MVRRWPAQSYLPLIATSDSTANKAALIWEVRARRSWQPGEERTFTYKQLITMLSVSQRPQAHGIQKGDRTLSTCHGIRKPRSPCWPARASVRSFGGLRASAPNRLPTAFSIRRARMVITGRRRLPRRGSCATKTKCR